MVKNEFFREFIEYAPDFPAKTSHSFISHRTKPLFWNMTFKNNTAKTLFFYAKYLANDTDQKAEFEMACD